MYLFFDRDGTLKEQITTSPVRVGDSSDVNKIFVYWDTEENITGCYRRFKKPNGQYTTSDIHVDTPTEAQIPYDQDRDLKYFKYGQTYPFYVFTIPEAVYEEIPDMTLYSVLFSCWFVYTDSNLETQEKTMGLVAFAVEPSTQSVAPDQNITIAQWNELVNAIMSEDREFPSITVTNIKFNNSLTPDSDALAVKNNELYWRGEKLATENYVDRVYALTTSTKQWDGDEDDYLWLVENPNSKILYNDTYYLKYKSVVISGETNIYWVAIAPVMSGSTYENVKVKRIILNTTDKYMYTDDMYDVNFYTKSQIDSNYYTNTIVDEKVFDALLISSDEFITLTGDDLAYVEKDNARLYYNGRFYEKTQTTETAFIFNNVDYTYTNSDDILTATRYKITIAKTTGDVTKSSSSISFYNATGVQNYVKNSTITIKSGSTSLGSFTLNQGTDGNVDIANAIGTGSLTISVSNDPNNPVVFNANDTQDKVVAINVPTVNDGTLTIKLDSTTLGTFSANQSSDETITLNTSDLGINDGKLYLQINGTDKAIFKANSADNVTFNVTASDLGITNAMHFAGVSSTAIADGDTTNPITISGSSYTAVAGDVVLYGNKEFVWTGNAWEELGNEGSYALNSITITGDGALEGGGNLTQNRTITHKQILGSQYVSGLYKLSLDAYGHVTAITAVAQSDITALNIPATDKANTYTSLQSFKNVYVGQDSNGKSYQIQFSYDGSNTIVMYADQYGIHFTDGDDEVYIKLDGTIIVSDPNDTYTYSLSDFATKQEVQAKQDKITSQNMLESDLVDDAQQTHKFVTQAMYEYLDNVLYQAPSILTFSLEDNNQNIIPTTNEVGSSFTCAGVIFSMSNVSNVSGNLTLTIGNYSQTITPSSSTEIALDTNQTISSSTTATLSGTDTKGNTFSKTYTMAFNTYTYTKATSSSTAPTSSLIKQTGSSYSIPYSAGDYIYFYSKSSGKQVQQNVLGTWTTLSSTNLGQVSITQNNGATGTYYCYRIGAFANGGTDTFRLA